MSSPGIRWSFSEGQHTVMARFADVVAGERARWQQPTLYVPGRDARMDVMVRVAMAVGTATVAGYAGLAAGFGLGDGGAPTVLLWCISALGAGLVAVWALTPVLLAGWPATVYALIADLAIAAGLACLGNENHTFVGCAVFALIGTFITLHVAPAGLIAHFLFTLTFIAIAAAHAYMRTSTSVVVVVIGSTIFAWLVAISPLMVRRVWVSTSHDAHLAAFDPLTGLLNRAGLDRDFRRMVHRVTHEHLAMVVIAIDLDNFKTVNDRYGHSIGDAVLRETAHHLTHHYGRAAAIARCGGEEFTIIITGRLPELREVVITTPTATSGVHGPPVTMSVGAVLCESPTAPDALPRAMDAADHAMYAAKAGGGNRACTRLPTP